MGKRIIISGGGTGGHIYPAIAIAHALKTLDAETEILFVGAEGKMEMEKVPIAGYKIYGLPVVGIKRSLSISNLLFPFKLLNSLLKAHKIIRNFKPDAVVGVGGYASGPVLMIAALQRIPSLIQEQNSYAGVTNKILSRWVRTICVAYPNMDAFFPAGKIRLLGNPVRQDIISANEKKREAFPYFKLNPEKKTILVIGGSLGARSINLSIASGLRKITEAGHQVLWQTGKTFIAEANDMIEQLGLSTQVKAFEFIYEMDLAYAVSDVVISRAGALSVSELCLVARPAILVPYPYATADHQTKNASSLSHLNAALLIKDSDLGQQLIPAALALILDDAQKDTLTHNIAKLARPDAAADIASEIIKLS